MTNQELIEKLSQLPMSANVVIFSDENDPMHGKTRIAVYEAIDLTYGHYISIDVD